MGKQDNKHCTKQTSVVDCNMSIEITNEMCLVAKDLIAKRGKNLSHHFVQGGKENQFEKEISGYLGEFAFSVFLGYDWHDYIDTDFSKPHSFDIKTKKGKKVEIKTYTLPSPYFQKLIYDNLENDDMYSAVLINKNQLFELDTADYVFWGVFQTGDYDRWYPVGYLPTATIKERIADGTYRVCSHWGKYKSKLPSQALAIGNKDVIRVGL